MGNLECKSLLVHDYQNSMYLTVQRFFYISHGKGFTEMYHIWGRISFWYCYKYPTAIFMSLWPKLCGPVILPWIYRTVSVICFSPLWFFVILTLFNFFTSYSVWQTTSFVRQHGLLFVFLLSLRVTGQLTSHLNHYAL